MSDPQELYGIEIQRLAAFAVGDAGGNPAGVALCDAFPADEQMQRIAATIGYSETVFAAPTTEGYRVRYFAPEQEIPFCGHATIALGAALAERGITGVQDLTLNDGSAMVEGFLENEELSATLHSSPTRHQSTPPDLFQNALDLFDLSPGHLDDQCPPAIIEAGARHLLLCVRERRRLAAMNYEMEAGAALMREWGLATICLVQRETASRYHARNPFAAGGVYEDPATGAAAAALVAYLREIDASTGIIEVRQGEDMGVPCLLTAYAPAKAGGRARVHGKVRRLAE